jgi:type VI secretion system VasD/TssJ family lipoprotein
MKQPYGLAAHARIALLCAGLVLLSGCGALHKGAPTIVITLTATADCNNCGGGSASALKYRIFQVADDGAARIALNKGLPWAKQLDAAGSNVLTRVVEEFISPGATKQVSTLKDPAAKAIVIEGNFCKKTGASWYIVHPLTKSGPLKISVGSTGLTLASGK